MLDVHTASSRLGFVSRVMIAGAMTLFFVTGCDCGSGPSPGGPGSSCASSASCDPGLACVDGRCTPSPDAGATDAGDTFDGALACPPVERCGGLCCGAGDECVDDACLPACASALRCGPALTCCAAGDLCIADACTTPGDACTEELDCPSDAFCDRTIDRCLPRGPTRCEYHPPPGVFAPTQQWAWTGSDVAPTSIHVMMAPVVGDIDADGVPEVVFHTYNAVDSYSANGVLRAVRGDTGVEVLSVTDPVVCPMFGAALGDLDGDGVVEIITAEAPCSAARIVALHADGSVVWRSTAADGGPHTTVAGFGAASIADLEGDGMAEVIVGGVVLGHDGVVRWSARPTAGSGCCGGSPNSPLSAAYDVTGDGQLEVIAGNAVWNADGTVLWENAALEDGFVAVADFFADAMPDVVVVHQGAVSIRRGSDGTMVWGPVVLPGGADAGRGGPPTVADFDGDGLPEIGVAGAIAYVVFDPDGVTPILWQRATQDRSSNVTGSSVFDFDGDGRAEVVYNDECYMRVYAGTDGAVLAEVPQSSHTLIEYPLIVDVDADGNAEIVFAGNAAVNPCSAIPDYTGRQAGIRVFRDDADNWVGTRPVWNQHTYHVTNVREDLSIPTGELPNWQRFNTFRQNSQSFDAPDLTGDDLDHDGTACPLTLELSARIHNRGAVTVGAGLAVTFYLGTPAAPGRAVATVRTTAPIPPGGSAVVVASFTPMASDIGRDLPFFVRTDDVGDGTGEENECTEDNNVAEGVYSCTSID